jgi:RNase P subunit RPR2
MKVASHKRNIKSTAAAMLRCPALQQQLPHSQRSVASRTPPSHATQPPAAQLLAYLKRQSLTAHLLFQDRRPSSPHSSLIESVVAAFSFLRQCNLRQHLAYINFSKFERYFEYSMSQLRVHPSPAEKETNASALSSPATTTMAQDNDKCFTKQLSFGAGDEFFHGMLSYRVNSEGPNGNNLALLLWDSCCQRGISSRQNSKAEEAIQRSIDAVNQFGKWPRIFPHPSSSGVRFFLDQKNLRPGFDWKGTGNRADGGFLGALSSSLTLVPLLSATPARFKITTSGSEGRFQFKERGNFAIQESLDIFCESVGESSSGNKETKHLLCTDFRSSDNSFILKSVGGETLKPESIENASFWTSRYTLPSNGSGPKGSVSEMLTIMQKEEFLSFHVKRSSGFVTILEIVELSDHVFFKTEKILLQLDQNSEKLHEFAIEAVEVQGSIIGEIKSIIQVNCGESLRPSEASESTIRGKTKAIDRKDNVLIEFMLARALNMILAADTNPHPCKIILPVFVDDLSVIVGMSKCLSTSVSLESAKEVKQSLLQILKKDAISLAEEQKLINVSIKDVVLFFSNLQGCQLSKGETRSISMEAKAELVCSSILSTVGIEAELYQCMSDNPLAHELLEFINQRDMGHIGFSLIKFDVNSLETFSNLSSKSIETIAQDSRLISKKSEVRETADITSALCAAKASPLVLPVSQRLKFFEDNDASFMTIIYSTFALEQALRKPLFNFILFAFAITMTGLSVNQYVYGELGKAVNNLVRGVGLALAWICIVFFKTAHLARLVLFFTFALSGLASIADVVFFDKFLNGRFDWYYSQSCCAYEMSFKHQYATCIAYQISYNSYQALLFLLGAAFTIYRQDWFWRLMCIGCSILVIINLVFRIQLENEELFDYFVVVANCSVLIVTELLKQYGTLQAIRSTQKGQIKLTEIWCKIIANHEQDLKEIAKFVSDKCSSKSFAILDRSKDLGKWRARSQTEPPKIRQSVSDFDELYLRAVSLNDVFQKLIESFFAEHSNPSRYLYNVTSNNQLPFKGNAIRGPVKRPHRAIAKVFTLAKKLI